jgi:WD40 repeat protein
LYLYSSLTGTLLHRIGELPNSVGRVAFSPNGRHLAALLTGRGGLRVFDRTRGWSEVARDENTRGTSSGLTFAPDGRLATTSYDGLIRLYDPSFLLRKTLAAASEARLHGISFSPEGTYLAVGYDRVRVDVIDGEQLTPLHEVRSAGLNNFDLSVVAWAADGTLFASGRFNPEVRRPVWTWTAEGRGERRSLPAGRNSVTGLKPLAGGDLLVVGADPFVARLTPQGRFVWSQESPSAEFRGQEQFLAVSGDGGVIDFGYTFNGNEPARFDLSRLTLTANPSPDDRTAQPRQSGLRVEGWNRTSRPTLDGEALPLWPGEVSRSFALHPHGDRFVLGSDRALRAFSAAGKVLWQQSGLPIAWAVNITGDGRLVVAAYSDGKIRWHRMDDGREILTFMPLTNRKDWVAWTPEGFYAASAGAHGVLRWHVNQPDWQPARDHAVADIPGFYRPEAIRLVLQEGETPRAIGLATVAEQREKVRLLTNSRVPPGARLHLLAIGISRYDQAHLRLSFAQKDAQDVVSALSGTQDALYVAGSRQYLVDTDATRVSIRRGLDTLRQAMTGADDLAVVHFSGHGAMVDGELYLLPRDVQAGDAVALKDSALPVAALRAELERIATRGRVLILLDACYSGGASLDGRATEVASAVLGKALAGPSVSVLTSSSSSQPSREDPGWQNGALSLAVLEALGWADTNHDGLINTTELAAYVDRRVRSLTQGAQQPAMEIRFDGTLFAVR